MRTVVRHTGRVLPVHAGRVLLLRGQDPSRPEAGQWWFTVGGACEPGETTAAAARREAREEAGLNLPEDLGPVVLRREAAFEFAGEWLEQTEEYYLCIVASNHLTTTRRTALEHRTISAHRWWTVAELHSTLDVVYPSNLADLLDHLIGPVDPIDGISTTCRQ